MIATDINGELLKSLEGVDGKSNEYRDNTVAMRIFISYFR